MKCNACFAEMGHVTAGGEPMLRTRGIVLKAEGAVALCPRCKADVPLAGELAKALGDRIVNTKKPILFLKGNVQGYTRKDGTVVQGYTNTKVRRAEAALPTRSHITHWKVGRQPEEAGAPPEGATGCVGWNMGRGHEYVWTKRARHNEGVWQDGAWNHRTDAMYAARHQHWAKHGTWEPNEAAHDHWEHGPAGGGGATKPKGA